MGLPPEAATIYREATRWMAKAFARKERAGSASDAAAVKRVLTDRNPRTRYLAGKDAAKLTMLAWLLPETPLDLAILRTFGLTTT